MSEKPYLNPLSQLYRAAISARASAYKKGYLKSHDLGAPAISVGNITVGGTGKTPLTALITEMLLENGEKPCILTRGYGRKNSKEKVLVSDGREVLAEVEYAGDEPYELAQKLKGKAAIIADANRVEAASWAMENLGPTVFLLDDGFQHLRVKRDLNIAVIDATNPFGNGKLLPQGILREPVESLKRADIIVVSRANLVSKEKLRSLRKELGALAPESEIYSCGNKITGLSTVEDLFSGEFINANSKTFFAFCGLGNPDGFLKQLAEDGFDVAGFKTFRDHHAYSPDDMRDIQNEAKAGGADALLTTAKDAVKLRDLELEMPCYFVRLEMIFDQAEAFRNRILSITKNN